jgi:hypothetical protein
MVIDLVPGPTQVLYRFCLKASDLQEICVNKILCENLRTMDLENMESLHANLLLGLSNEYQKWGGMVGLGRYLETWIYCG